MRDPVRGRERAAGAQARLDRVGHSVAVRARIARLEPVAQQRVPVAYMRAERGRIGERIARHAPAGDVAARARPAPFLRMRDQARRDRHPLDIAHRRHQMRIVHRVAGEAALEQIAAPSLARVDVARVAPMRLGQRGAQAVRCFGDEDEVDVRVHQAPGEAGHARRRAALPEQIEIEDAVGIGEEDRLAAIAALGDVVRGVGDDDAGEAGHGVGLA